MSEKKKVILAKLDTSNTNDISNGHFRYTALKKDEVTDTLIENAINYFSDLTDGYIEDKYQPLKEYYNIYKDNGIKLIGHAVDLENVITTEDLAQSKLRGIIPCKDDDAQDMIAFYKAKDFRALPYFGDCVLIEFETMNTDYDYADEYQWGVCVLQRKNDREFVVQAFAADDDKFQVHSFEHLGGDGMFDDIYLIKVYDYSDYEGANIETIRMLVAYKDENGDIRFELIVDRDYESRFTAIQRERTENKNELIFKVEKMCLDDENGDQLIIRYNTKTKKYKYKKVQ